MVSSSPAWWQLWLQLTLFAGIRARPSLTEGAAQRAYATVVNRHERDHDDLAVRGMADGRAFRRPRDLEPAGKDWRNSGAVEAS